MAHHVTSGVLVANAANLGVADDSHQLLYRAHRLYVGLEALSSLGVEEAYAALFLASWSLELSLKAYLARQGQGKKELQHIRHDLAALWVEAAKHGLRVPISPPQWCLLLNETHKGPSFHQRYPSNSSATVSPNVGVLAQELSAFLALVRSQIQSESSTNDV